MCYKFGKQTIEILSAVWLLQGSAFSRPSGPEPGSSGPDASPSPDAKPEPAAKPFPLANALAHAVAEATPAAIAKAIAKALPDPKAIPGPMANAIAFAQAIPAIEELFQLLLAKLAPYLAMTLWMFVVQSVN